MTRAISDSLHTDTTPATSLTSILRATMASFILLTLLTGVVYPMAITVIGKVAFPNQAEGNLLGKDGRPTRDESSAIGSSLIGQTFDQPQYFWSRPSATSPMAYNAASSSGSSIGPSSIASTVQSRVDALHQADPTNAAPVPVDLMTASGSGLDPHESVAAAEYQVPRIARIRNVDPEKIKALIASHTDERQLGIFGERVVNVLKLNLALDALAPYTPPASQAAAATSPGTAR